MHQQTTALVHQELTSVLYNLIGVPVDEKTAQRIVDELYHNPDRDPFECVGQIRVTGVQQLQDEIIVDVVCDDVDNG